MISSKHPYDRDEYYIARVRRDMRWRDLEQSKPLQSGLERMVGLMLVFVSIGGLLYAASRFF